MLQFREHLRDKDSFDRGRTAIQKAPDTAAAIAVFAAWADGIACLEREVGLDGVDGGIIVIFDLAKLEEAVVVRVVWLGYSAMTTQMRAKWWWCCKDSLFAAFGCLFNKEVDGEVA